MLLAASAAKVVAKRRSERARRAHKADHHEPRRAHKVRTSGCALVLVQQPAEAVYSVHPRGTVLAERGWSAQRIRRREGERSVRALAVVVVDVGVERSLELPFAKDEQPVQALLTDRAHPALGMGR